jgi:hypothetical protein
MPTREKCYSLNFGGGISVSKIGPAPPLPVLLPPPLNRVELRGLWPKDKEKVFRRYLEL